MKTIRFKIVAGINEEYFHESENKNRIQIVGV